jgi:hypothetical protein
MDRDAARRDNRATSAEGQANVSGGPLGDSTVQARSNAVILDALARHRGSQLYRESITVRDGARVQLDGVSDDRSALEMVAIKFADEWRASIPEGQVRPYR